MSLPDAWIERIFLKLSVTYGQAFLRQYDGVDLADVKANWAHELSGFQQMPGAIRYGLEFLPADRPPNVMQFRDLCRRSPPPPPPLQIAGPPVDPAVAVEARKIFAAKPRRANPRAWAETLRDREQQGAKLTQAQRSAWREALKAGSDE